MPRRSFDASRGDAENGSREKQGVSPPFEAPYSPARRAEFVSPANRHEREGLMKRHQRSSWSQIQIPGQKQHQQLGQSDNEAEHSAE